MFGIPHGAVGNAGTTSRNPIENDEGRSAKRAKFSHVEVESSNRSQPVKYPVVGGARHPIGSGRSAKVTKDPSSASTRTDPFITHAHRPAAQTEFAEKFKNLCGDNAALQTIEEENQLVAILDHEASVNEFTQGSHAAATELGGSIEAGSIPMDLDITSNISLKRRLAIDLLPQPSEELLRNRSSSGEGQKNGLVEQLFLRDIGSDAEGIQWTNKLRSELKSNLEVISEDQHDSLHCLLDIARIYRAIDSWTEMVKSDAEKVLNCIDTGEGIPDESIHRLQQHQKKLGYLEDAAKSIDESESYFGTENIMLRIKQFPACRDM